MITLELDPDQASSVWVALIVERANPVREGDPIYRRSLSEVIDEIKRQSTHPTPQPFPLEGVPAEPDGSSEGEPDNSARLEQGEGI